MWFDGWSDLARIVLVGAAAYVTLIVVLRVFGKRTLGQFNAFDFVVTVALGSTVATILLSATVSFSEGAVALLLLAALQFLVAWTAVRIPAVRRAIAARPTLLVSDGEVRHEALRAKRLELEELEQAVRASGIGSLSLVAAAVLESNGQISVISRDQLGDGSALPAERDDTDARDRGSHGEGARDGGAA